ncbi:MAG: ATP-binding protein [Gammaproteobacteria bacterium]|nr:ATP-binding protein [Gammaproteobacteria bacterium]
MFQRDLKSVLMAQSCQFPVMTVLGPRQSGKTTLVKKLYQEKAYFNLEEPDTRALILSDPRHFFSTNSAGVILDEIQRAPELLSYIQTIVDQKKEVGQFILTGSHQIALGEEIAQSLAGRTGILELLPLSLHELQQSDLLLDLDDLLLAGGYPRIYDKTIEPIVYFRAYERTYVERDVRQIINVQSLDQFQRFMQLAAGRVGSILNFESLANDVGVSNPTIRAWLSVLQASYLVTLLPPYFENFGKRVLKAPKLFFSDVGLVSYLLGIETSLQMNRNPIRGHLFENLVVLEVMKARLNQGLDAKLYYYRDNHQNEIDLIIQQGHDLIPIEIKSTHTFTPSLLKNLKFYQKLVGKRCTKAFLIYAGEREQWIGDIFLMNYKNAANILSMIK